jgi:hypothetical protein
MRYRALFYRIVDDLVAVAGCSALLAVPVTHAGAQSDAYPTRPTARPEAEEIALAIGAAPREISGKADIWILTTERGPTKVRDGTNGCTCMVNRDLHEGSLYPICFDQEGTRSTFRQQLLELSLRFRGRSEQQVKDTVAEAFRLGTLIPPARPSIAYMMSSRQVLFSSPDSSGRRVGPWHPHIMISMPYARAEQFGLGDPSHIDGLSLDDSGAAGASLIIRMPTWADSLRT